MLETAYFPDLPKLRREYSFEQILQGVCISLELDSDLEEGSIFGAAHCRFYGKSTEELTEEEWSTFEALAQACAEGREQPPIYVFSWALQYYYDIYLN